MDLPDKVRKDLKPQEVEAIRNYIDPTSDTFSQKRDSGVKAGYSESYAYEVFQLPRVRKAIDHLERRRLEEAEQLMDLAKRLSADAMLDLARQLSLGQELRVINPEEVFGDDLEHVRDEDDVGRLRELNRHNDNARKMAEARQKVIETLMAYGIGKPEERHRIIQEKRVPDEVDLSDLSKEELEQLGEAVKGVREARHAESPKQLPEEPLEADYEIVE